MLTTINPPIDWLERPPSRGALERPLGAAKRRGRRPTSRVMARVATPVGQVLGNKNRR
jgi:hypothetical protein